MTRIVGHLQNQFVGYVALVVACLGAMGTTYAAAAPVSGAVAHAVAGTTAVAKPAPDRAYEVRRDAAVSSADGGSIVTLPLPAGAYLVQAKATITGKGGVSINITCSLTVGASKDLAPDNVTVKLSHTVVDQLVATLPQAGSATFTCVSDASSATTSSGNVAPDVSNVSLVATAVSAG